MLNCINTVEIRRILLIGAMALVAATEAAAKCPTAFSPNSPEPRNRKTTAHAQESDFETCAPDVLPRSLTPDKILKMPDLAREHDLKRSSRTFSDNAAREGIDVSHYQGFIDWQRVASEGQVSYAYMKCSEGATIQDEYYRRNVEEARRAGLYVGAYHFYRSGTSPQEQLNNMISIARKADFDLVPIIDIEHRGQESREAFIKNLRVFIDAVEKYYGCKPLLYTGQNFYNKHLAGEFVDYLWMIAKYQEELPILTDNHTYAFWQFTSKGHVPGIRGNVDRSCLMDGFALDDIAM